jgi:hypothetical protein
MYTRNPSCFNPLSFGREMVRRFFDFGIMYTAVSVVSF